MKSHLVYIILYVYICYKGFLPSLGVQNKKRPNLSPNIFNCIIIVLIVKTNSFMILAQILLAERLKTMTLQDMKSKIETEVLQSMRDYLMDFDEDYMPSDDDPYKMSDIDECGQMLEDFINELSEVEDDQEKIMECVKSTVISLNELNERLDSQLIETQQREDICMFILDAAELAGLTTSEDVTEEWREW